MNGEEQDFDVEYGSRDLEDRRILGHGTMSLVAAGGDPVSQNPPVPRPVSLGAALSYRNMMEMKSNRALDAVLSAPGSGWQDITGFVDEMTEAYKARNAERLVKAPKNAEEQLQMMQQMEGVVADPNRVAMLRQALVKLDQEGKKADPRFSIFNHPKTAKYAQFLNREAGAQGGLFTTGEQEMELGVTGRATQGALEFTEGVTDFGVHAVRGMWDLGSRAVMALGGPDMRPQQPLNWAVGPNGEVISAGAKVPGFVDGVSSLWAAAWNKRAEDVIGSVQEAREMDARTRSTLMSVTMGVSRLAGAAIGFGGPAGMATRVGMKAGAGGTNALVKGFDMLTKGVASNSPRMVKTLQVMGAGAGGMLSNAMLEAGAYGQVEGYGKSFANGLVFGVPMMVFGAAGGRLEYFLKHRKNIPGRVAAAAGSTIEGLGFGSAELLAPELLPSAWGFVKDPNEETWAVYARNVGGFVLGSVLMRGRSPNPFREPEMFHVERNVQRQRAAEGLAEGKVAPESLPAGQDVETVRRYGEVSKQLRTTAEPEAQRKLLAESRELEARMDEGERQAGEAQTRQQAAEAEAVQRTVSSEDTARQERIDALTDAIRDPDTSPQERQGLMRRLKQIEGEISKASSTEVSKEGHRVEFTNDPDRASYKKWILRDAEGNPIGSGSYREEGTKAFIESADVGEAQGKGIYPEILKEYQKRYTEIESEIDQTPASKRAWEKAGMGSTGKWKRPEGMPEVDAIKPGRENKKGTVEPGLGSMENQPTQWVQPAEGGAPTRASSIFKEMQGRPDDPVQVPMRAGKIRMKNVAGVFKNNENLVRTEEGRNVAVGAHEWSHAMHRHILGAGKGKGFTQAALNQLHQIGKDPAVRADLDRMLQRYPGKLTPSQIMKEAWAEWHARDMLSEAGLRAEFPALSREMDAIMNRPENARFKMQKERIKKLIYQYHAQGSLSRVRQSIVRESDAPTESDIATAPTKLQQATRRIAAEAYDDTAFLKASQERWAKAVGKDVGAINILDNPARLLDALRMTSSKVAKDMVGKGVHVGGKMVPGMRKVLGGMSTRSVEDFTTYLVARRNLDLMKSGKTTQLPFNDYEHARLTLEAQYPEFRQKAADLKAWTDSMVDWVVVAGGLGEKEAQNIKDAYSVYVPFYRVIEGPKRGPGGRGVAEKGTGLARIKGSTFEVRDPLVALQEVAQSLVTKAHQNQVVGALYRMAAAHEMGGVATVIPRTAVPQDHPIKQILEQVEKGMSPKAKEAYEQVSGHSIEDIFGSLIAADKLDPATITTFMQRVMPTGEKSVIAYTPRMSKTEIDRLVSEGANRAQLENQNGKVQWLEVDTAAYELLMGVNDVRAPDNLLSTGMRAARDTVRLFATGVSPGFTFANMIRDALSEPVFSREGKFRPFGGLVKLVKGAYEYHRNGDTRRMYEELGVKTSTFHNEAHRRWLTGQPSARTKIGRVWDWLKDKASTVEEFFAHPENYLRINEFKRVYDKAKAEGKSEQEARMLSLEAGREITVNFARAGTMARAINQAIPYFNASIQGQRKLWRALSGADGKTPTERRKMQAMAIANGIAQLTIPTLALYWLNRDEEWYQDLPSWRKAGYWNTKIGEQIISIPKPFELGTLFATIPEWIASHSVEGDVPMDIGNELFGMAMPYMKSAGDLLPALLRPTIETLFNYDSFRGRPVVPDWMGRSRVPAEQASSMTTKTAVALGELFGVSPAKVEHWLGTSTAGGTTAMFRFIDDVTSGELTTALTAPNPLQRFTKQSVHGQGRFVDELYDLGETLDQKKGSDQINPREDSILSRVNTAKRRISELRKLQRAGRLSREDADRQAYEIARPIVEDYR